MRDERRCRYYGTVQTIKRGNRSAVAEGGNVPSAGIDYNLILARPTPPPSAGEASFMRGHCDHRTNCSSTKHMEGL